MGVLFVVLVGTVTGLVSAVTLSILSIDKNQQGLHGGVVHCADRAEASRKGAKWVKAVGELNHVQFGGHVTHASDMNAMRKVVLKAILMRADEESAQHRPQSLYSSAHSSATTPLTHPRLRGNQLVFSLNEACRSQVRTYARRIYWIIATHSQSGNRWDINSGPNCCIALTVTWSL
ncbi:unnamed protein product [Taenia asiatica]|uniref:Secreted protein n=1 Tax=Taenia asiatica TaxID=60517 RepID=A0A0R3VWX6_TAEAS|nr:unnamed protein product [Taenia asiatica]